MPRYSVPGAACARHDFASYDDGDGVPLLPWHALELPFSFFYAHVYARRLSASFFRPKEVLDSRADGERHEERRLAIFGGCAARRDIIYPGQYNVPFATKSAVIKRQPFATPMPMGLPSRLTTGYFTRACLYAADAQ